MFRLLYYPTNGIYSTEKMSMRVIVVMENILNNIFTVKNLHRNRAFTALFAQIWPLKSHKIFTTNNTQITKNACNLDVQTSLFNITQQQRKLQNTGSLLHNIHITFFHMIFTQRKKAGGKSPGFSLFL